MCEPASRSSKPCLGNASHDVSKEKPPGNLVGRQDQLRDWTSTVYPAGRTQPFLFWKWCWILRFGPMDSRILSYSVWDSTVSLKPHCV